MLSCSWLIHPLDVHANPPSQGAACSDTPNACYSDELKALIEECISDNMDAAPKGNPGPFAQGYNSIVVLTGQCYGGGMSELTGIGDDVVVGAAAAADKESTWEQTGNDVGTAKYLWLDKLIQEINSNPNRKIKDILDAVKTANPDPGAMTPAPSTSAGGNDVTMGNPTNTGTKSYHAVLFGGVQDTAASYTPPDAAKAAGQNAAAQKALDDMETALKDKLNVPAGNIDKKFPGTCQELKDMIKAAWNSMNDNEQFILVLANHGSQCTTSKDPPVEDPKTGEQEASVITPNTFGSENVTRPSVFVETEVVNEPAPVLVNDQPVGNLQFSTGPMRHQFLVPRPLLGPPGQLNIVRVLAPSFNSPVTAVGVTTGPVAAASFVAVSPAASEWGLILLIVAVGACGALLIRRRAYARLPDRV
jgi:hypothetical protein